MNHAVFGFRSGLTVSTRLHKKAMLRIPSSIFEGIACGATFCRIEWGNPASPHRFRLASRRTTGSHGVLEEGMAATRLDFSQGCGGVELRFVPFNP